MSKKVKNSINKENEISQEEVITDKVETHQEKITANEVETNQEKVAANNVKVKQSKTNMLKEAKTYGSNVQPKNIILYLLAYSGIIGFVCWFMGLNPIITIATVVISAFFLPRLVINAYKRRYEKIKFADISQYIEQMLYAFKNSRKIYKSIEDILPLFKTSPIYKDLVQMQKDILEKGNAEALAAFEEKYDCDKIAQMHKFILESETIGGDIEDTIDLLLDDNARWKERTEAFQKDRNKWRVSTVGAILISFALCILMEKMLPTDIDISKNIFIQITTGLAFVLEIIVYNALDKRLSVSFLNNLTTRSDEEIKKYYEEIVNYDKKKTLKKSIKGSIIPIVASIVTYILFSNTFLLISLLIFGAMMFATPFMNHKRHYKAIREEITIQFPKWLMSMAMLAQSNSIQVSLYKSIFTAPTVLKPELIKLNNGLRENPNSVDPYFDFMKDFNMPEITSSMKMFYAISSGAGSDTQKQIKDIIKRTNIMVDKAEKIANDNFVAGLYTLFLAPQVVGAMKLMIDMVVFFITFSSVTATLS